MWPSLSFGLAIAAELAAGVSRGSQLHFGATGRNSTPTLCHRECLEAAGASECGCRPGSQIQSDDAGGR